MSSDKKKPGRATATGDGFVEQGGRLVIVRKGEPLPNGATAADVQPAERDKSGALQPKRKRQPRRRAT